jgi:hypothetical protein
VYAYIKLPDDGGNTGKKVATRSRMQGTDEVHDHVFALDRVPITPLYTETLIPTSTETEVLSQSLSATTIQVISLTGSLFRFRIKIAGSSFLTVQTSPATPSVILHLGDSGQVVNGILSVTAYHEESTAQLAQVSLFGYTVS